MNNGSITEQYRELEINQRERQIILASFQKNKENKIEVDRIISNERYNFKIETIQSGNIWSNCETLRNNIEKLNNEINLYEKLTKTNRPRF